MLPQPLTNCQIQKKYQKQSKVKGICSRNNLPKTKKRIFIINLDKY